MNVNLTVAPSPPSALSHAARPHAVVIGSGFGGLAAAIRLGARGYRVTVLERLGVLGGRAVVHRQDGFTFDAGPTIITAPHLLDELWALCGRRREEDVELRPMAPFYRIRFADGAVFTYSGGADAMRAEVARFSPEDVAGYERFMAYSAQVCRIGFERLGDQPFDDWRMMARVAPDLLRLGGLRSVYGAVARDIRDPRLRTVFSYHPLLIGGNPFTASAVYCLIASLERRWGVHYAMGGTGRLIAGLAGLIAREGHALRCNADVSAILVDRAGGGQRVRGVRLRSGEEIGADIVVSNACSAWTYRHLLPEDSHRQWRARRIERARYSMGLFIWYFGTDRHYPEIGHHTILLGPRYRALLDDIFRRKILARDMSLYLHRPSATDPSVAPPGCDAFYVLAPVPNLAADIDWAQAAEPYRRAIAAHLSATLLPNLEQHVVTSRVTTPADFAAQFLAFRGAAFGLEPVLTQSAWFRPHNKSSEIEGLYLVGAGTHPGAGVPGVLSSARVLDRVVPHVTAPR